MARSRRRFDASRSGQNQQSSQKDINGYGNVPQKTGSNNAAGKSKRNLTVVPPMSKKLSKKERKRLEKIVDKKNKKARRSMLLENLAEVQVKPSELAMFDSIAHLGTKNSRITSLSKRPIADELQNAIEESPISIAIGLKGWTGKRKRRKLEKKEKSLLIKKESSSSELSSSSEEENEVVDMKNEIEKSEENSLNENENQTCADVQEQKEDEKKTEEKPKESGNVDNEKVVEKKNDVDPKSRKPATYVHLNRSNEIQKARSRLPILAEEQAIMEAISENPITIVCGQTGSGKTTQVPQFLYEAGYAKEGMIGITEPRRVAAVSMSKRVAKEMNLPTSQISYQIRYENNLTDETCMKFMTDGVLARELKEDFLLTKYSVIILDEAHERTSNTDVLIGLLSRIVPLRNKKGKPLKLVIMSATLRVEDFTENKRLFKSPPPVLKIDSRQYPVTIHFNRKTPVSDDPRKCPYLNEAYTKICRIHRTLPPGGILVFVTGRQEVIALKARLNATFPSEPLPETTKEIDTKDPPPKVKINLDDYDPEPSPDDSRYDHDGDDHVMDDDDEEGGADDEMETDDSVYTTEMDKTLPLHVLPLYALLASNKQRQVFEPVPDQCRLCVVATNVAETSLTIPGIKYVIDTGKVKKKLYDKVTGISAFRVTWISKASANQRAGRAGRTESGHTYRLYSSALFQDFPEHDEPEIASKPVAGLVLQMKSMRIDRVINFPFPTPLPRESLESAEKLLVSLGALLVKPCSGSLKDMKEAQFTGKITPLGNLISSFPVHPRFGKMIAEATRHGNDIIAYVIAIVAALTVQEIFFTPSHDPDNNVKKEEARQLAARLHHLKTLWSSVGGGPERQLLGDLMVMLGAIGSAEYSESLTSFCACNCLRVKAMLEIRKLRHQLTNTVKCVLNNTEVMLDPKMKPPTDDQVRLLRQITLSAMADHVARKVPLSEISEDCRSKMRGAYKSLLIEENVYIHPDSVMSRDPLPDFVVFQEITETDKTKRSYMRDVLSVEPGWLALYCPHYCTFSKPVDEPPPRYDVTTDDVMCHATANYGRPSWPLGLVEISYPSGLERYRWFACFLLDGQVVSKLKEFTPLLLSKPTIMTKSWAKLQSRTDVLLRALTSKGVDKKEKLLKVWKEDASFLKSAFMEWIPQSHYHKLMTWPPV